MIYKWCVAVYLQQHSTPLLIVHSHVPQMVPCPELGCYYWDFGGWNRNVDTTWMLQRWCVVSDFLPDLFLHLYVTWSELMLLKLLQGGQQLTVTTQNHFTRDQKLGCIMWTTNKNFSWFFVGKSLFHLEGVFTNIFLAGNIIYWLFQNRTWIHYYFLII